MGRPKGLRKGPDGKWYMPGEVSTTPKKLPSKPALTPDHDTPAMRKMYPQRFKAVSAPLQELRKVVSRGKPIIGRPFEPKYQRNDIVRVSEGTALVLGYVNTKVVLILLDGVTRLTLDESSVKTLDTI